MNNGSKVAKIRRTIKKSKKNKIKKYSGIFKSILPQDDQSIK